MTLYYVDNRYDSPGSDGSEERPWLYLDDCIPHLGPGDTLNVVGDERGPRVYRQGMLTLPQSGQPDAKITIRALPGTQVELRETSGEPHRHILNIPGAWWQLNRLGMNKNHDSYAGCVDIHGDYNDIVECTMRNVHSDWMCRIRGGNHNAIRDSIISDGYKGPGGDCIAMFVAGGDFNTIIGNTTYNVTDGVQIYDKFPTQGTLIENNHLYALPGSNPEDGIDIKINGYGGDNNAPVVIRGNVIHGFYYNKGDVSGTGSNGQAIQLHSAASNVLIERNVIYDCNLGIRAPGVGVVIRYNVFRDMSQHRDNWINAGILATGGDTQIYHNTFRRLPVRSLYFSDGASIRLINNIFEDAGGIFNEGDVEAHHNGWFGSGDSIPGDYDSIGDDAGFVSVDSCYLAEDSPCIDAGVPLDGEEFTGEAPDLGAFEYESGDTKPPDLPDPPDPPSKRRIFQIAFSGTVEVEEIV